MALTFQILILSTTASTLQCNPSQCAPSWVIFTQKGDDLCDTSCMSSYCNWDRLDSSSYKSDSDCYKTCTALLCDPNNLGNGVCDQSCNFIQCGYDWGDCGYCSQNCFQNQLGNLCNSQCQNSACYFDLSICSDCSTGCTHSLLTNGICNPQCNFASCNYDNGDCSSTSCSDNCYDYMIENGQCSSECQVVQCEYDLTDCLCSQGCLDQMIGNGVCESVCDKQECGFDGGDCGDCSSGCFQNSVGDGNCNQECLNEGCKWDGLDCGCSEACPDSLYGLCNPECMSTGCFYDLNCTDTDYRMYILATQLVSWDFDVYTDYTRCTELQNLNCPKESLYFSNFQSTGCEIDCQNSECVYAWGACNSNRETCSDIGCAICYQDEPDACLMCNSGYKQYYSTCVSQCPTGYSPQIFQFYKNTSVCVIEDNSSQESPYKIYVGASGVNQTLQEYGSGTEQEPFKLLSLALASLTAKYTDIILTEAGNYQLTQVPENSPYQNFLSDRLDPLAKNGYEPEIIRIYPKNYSFVPDFLIVSDQMMIFYVEKAVEITGVRIRSDVTNDLCPDEVYCNYCPNVACDQNVCTTDQDEIITTYLSNCTNWNDKSLFYLQKGASLTISNTDFQDISIQLKSIILAQDGDVLLQDVNFSDIRVQGTEQAGVVLFSGCEQQYSKCGSFTYNTGQVTLLNNGYQYDQTLDFRGFFYASKISEATFYQVTFSYNLVYSQNLIHNSILSLLVFDKILIEDCNFQYNYSQDSQISIDVSDMKMQFTLQENSNSIINELLYDHIIIKSSNFTNNAGENNSILTANFKRTLLNINLENLIISQNIASSGSMISFINTLIADQYLESTTKPAIVQSKRIQAYHTKRTLNLIHTTFNQNYLTDNGALYFQGMVNAILENLLITNHKSDHSANIDSIFTSLFKQNPKVYLTGSISEQDNQDYNQISFFQSCYNFLIVKSEFSNNQLQSGTPALNMNNQIVMEITDTKFQNNSGHIAETPIGLRLHGRDQFFLNNVNFTSNRNTHIQGYGALHLDGPEGQNVTLDGCTFTENVSILGSTIVNQASFFQMFGATFNANGDQETQEGFMIRISQGEDQVLELIDWSSNYNSGVVGGALYINDESEGMSTLSLNIQSCSFRGNQVSSIGAVLYFSPTVALSNDSYIRDTVFNQNKAGSKGILYLTYLRGQLTIQDSYFQNNQAVEGAAIFANPAQGSSLKLINTEFTGNIGNNVISMDDATVESLLITENCLFEENQGTSVGLVLTEWQDYDSVFTFNQHESSGGFLLEEKSTSVLLRTEFRFNSAEYGGAGLLRTNSMMNCIDCDFISNTATEFGGAIYAEQNSYFVVQESTFYNNTAKQGSAVLILGAQNWLSELQQVEIYQNKASDSGVISLILGSISIKNCEIYNNTGENQTSGISAIISQIEVQNTSFSRQLGSVGGFIYATTDSQILVQASNFTQGQAESSGGAIYAITSVVQIENCRFIENSAQVGGVILVYSDSQLIIKSSHFQNNSASLSSGVLDLFETEVSIQDTYFSSFTRTGISGTSLDSLVISDSTFENGSGELGGALYCIRCKGVQISSSQFRNLTADEGGAFYFIITQSDNQISDTYQIENCEFSQNQAINGGAIFVKNLKLKVQNSEFFQNSAIQENYQQEVQVVKTGRGGGLLLICPDFSYCQFSLTNSNFSNNTATYNGGAIAWQDIQPAISANTFSNNTSTYGPNISSFAIMVQQVNINGTLTSYSRTLIDTPIAAQLQNVASGQIIPVSLTLALVDHYQQIVETDNNSIAGIIGRSQDVAVSGITQALSSKGVYSFENFIVSATPGSSVSIQVISQAVDLQKEEKANQSTEFHASVDIIIHMRDCETGQITVGVECLFCQQGTYSIQTSDLECKNCPSEAQCYGGAEIAPNSGYWRSGYHSDKFWKCKNTDACDGHNPPPYLVYTGECAEGYTGNLCQSCDKGYSRSSPNTCGACIDQGWNALKLCGIFIAVLGICFVMVKTSLNSAVRPKAMHSVYIKIFTNYVQLVMLCASFQMQWPEFVLELFNVHETAGTVTQQAFSFDCFLMDEGDGGAESVFYTKLIIITFVPLLLTVLAMVFWVVVSIQRGKTKYLKVQMVASIVIIVFLAHPSLIKMMFSALNCMEIDEGEFWILDNLDIRCWDQTHQRIVIFVVLPSLSVWGVIVPTSVLCYLFRHRKNLGNIMIRKRLGFLFNGYTKSEYYWEFVILYRKIIIISCSVFLANLFSLQVQGLTLMFILVCSLIMQIIFSPYTEEPLNLMEVRSILVSSVTIYCGLYYLTGDLDQLTRIVFFCIILLSNCYFLYHWIVKTFGAGLEVLGKKIPCIRKYFLRKVQDGYDDEIFQVQEKQTHIVGRGKEKQYTLIGALKNQEEQLFPVTIESGVSMTDFFLKIVKKNKAERDGEFDDNGAPNILRDFDSRVQAFASGGKGVIQDSDQ